MKAKAYPYFTLHRLLRAGGVFLYSFLLLFLCYFPLPSAAQWHRQLQDSLGQIGAIYFLDLPGPPRVGLAGSMMHIESIDENGLSVFSKSLYRTEDGGRTWKKLLNVMPYRATEFAFKDNITGWMAADNGIWKTEDAGKNWRLVSAEGPTTSVFYNKWNRGLFTGGAYGFANLVSWDEGETWEHSGPKATGCWSPGITFFDSLNGIAAWCWGYPTGERWQRTADAGKTWMRPLIDSSTFYPLSIPQTKIGFALTAFGSVLRTDDQWESWRSLHWFPPDPKLERSPLIGTFVHPWTSACITGDLENLYVLVGEGCYHSTDEGETWEYLCGVASQTYRVPGSSYAGAQKFYAKGKYVYIGSEDSNYVASLWMLNVDSLHNAGASTSVLFDNGERQTSITAGDNVTAYFAPQIYSPAEDGSVIASDSAHLKIRFDPIPLRLKGFEAMNGWRILRTNESSGLINVWLASDTATLSEKPILSTTFSTTLTDSSTTIYLDEPEYYGHRTQCDCAVTANTASDSATILFAGCGDPLLLSYMRTHKLFDILSASPNPAATQITLEVARHLEGPIQYQLLDILGHIQKQGEFSSTKLTLGVADIPIGSYILRLSQNGVVQTREMLISR